MNLLPRSPYSEQPRTELESLKIVLFLAQLKLAETTEAVAVYKANTASPIKGASSFVRRLEAGFSNMGFRR